MKDNLLQEAAHNLDKKIEKVVKKLDHKVDTAEGWFTKKMTSAKKMYRRHILGDDSKITIEELYMLNMYIMAFSIGAMLGVGTGKLM
ncbi:hypothetical protein SK128_009171 [Halocaridina rubra]|uniref:Uncharacterized protein n=1 Tax=Halocaridina rubra TaxID=373956 RepID=A0AAN8XSV1_HALRR